MSPSDKTTANSPPAADTAESAPEGSIDIGQLAVLTGYVLRRAQLAVFDDFNASLATLQLRPAQYSVLLVLQRNPGCTQSAVAAALGIQRANFVTLLDTLEQRGLASRTPSQHDKRSHALHLTPLGQTTLQAAHHLVAEHDARQRDQLGPDSAGVIATLQRLANKPGPS